MVTCHFSGWALSEPRRRRHLGHAHCQHIEEAMVRATRGCARLVFKQVPHFWAAELAQDLLELLLVGSGWPGEVGELGLPCFILCS